MKTLLSIASILGLAFTVVPSFFVFYGIIKWNVHAKLMILGFVLYFGSALLAAKFKKETNS